METEEEINAKILKLTMVIHDNYPELSKYLNEMPITVPIDKSQCQKSSEVLRYTFDIVS
jgi:hypothetical protein